MIADQNNFNGHEGEPRPDDSTGGARGGGTGGAGNGGHSDRRRGLGHGLGPAGLPRGGGDPFDALADLFLGEFSPPRVAPTQVRRTTHVPARAGSPAPTAAHAAPGETGRPLTKAINDARTNVPAPTARPRPTVELVLCASVPPPASAWVHQYVRFVSRREAAPVAMVRLHGGHLRVELHTLEGDCPPLPTPRDAATAVATALRAAMGGRLLLSLEGLADADVLARLPGMDLTVLSACDEASAVAAYRRLKAIAAEGHGAGAKTVAAAGQVALPAELSVRLIAAGCDEAAARRLWLRLQDACETFLGAEVILGGHMPRVGIQAGEHRRSAVVWDQASSLSAAEIVAAVFAEPTPNIAGLAAADVAEAERGRAWRAALHPEDDHADDILIDADTAETQPGADDTADIDPPQPATANVPTQPAAAQRVFEHGLEAQPDASVPDLAALLRLSPLAARCPAAPFVQLAVDERGGVHCLASSAHGGSIECLTAASAWAKAHTQVLALTTELMIEPRQSVASHLFTQEPAAVRRLLDAELRVHLLAPVPADTSQRFIAVEMN